LNDEASNPGALSKVGNDPYVLSISFRLMPRCKALVIVSTGPVTHHQVGSLRQKSCRMTMRWHKMLCGLSEYRRLENAATAVYA
jgi:hypothetical protein